MKFLIDTQLPPSLAALFSWKGHVGKHTSSWPDGHFMDDKEILSIAREENFIIVTKDKDFLNHFLVQGFPPAVLMLALGNISNQVLTQIISSNFDSIDTAFQSGSHFLILESERLVIW